MQRNGFYRFTFILRIWRDGNTTPWHYVLEDTTTGERHGFSDLNELTAYLMHQLSLPC